MSKPINKVCVLLGGPSAEAEVSRKTGAAVAAALQRRGYDVTELEMDENAVVAGCANWPRTRCTTRCTANGAKTVACRACSRFYVCRTPARA